MKVSLILTCKNEESNILNLLRSIKLSSKKPNEIIIVDGGSTDKTQERIRKFNSEKDFKIRLFIKPGVNIAEGRNIAIEKSKFEIIAVTDCGCKLDKFWLENITNPFIFDKDLEVVFGRYRVYGRSLIGKGIASFFNQQSRGEKLADSALSSRSVAFKKKAWLKVGGYPENLYTGEDSLFFIRLKSKCKWILSGNAIVHSWHGRENLKKVYKMFYLYGRGAAQAKIWVLKSLLLASIYMMGFILLVININHPGIISILLILAIIFLSRGSINSYKETKSLKILVMMPIILFIRDLGLISGYIKGMIFSPKTKCPN